ncbi:hypothetical protein I316_01576 [Kwoniella heveanensis BCC8398]|uniref:Calcium uniporter protein, mitochondrial n=1 Tax=Kwoniella heveanensis BCC8398 TaxID=1296120 RepID=A0A1B9H121_9TREE|nr:hypothetical protein I316_01576 [Kwoniella heveanensis BCC8398]
MRSSLTRTALHPIRTAIPTTRLAVQRLTAIRMAHRPVITTRSIHVSSAPLKPSQTISRFQTNANSFSSSSSPSAPGKKAGTEHQIDPDQTIEGATDLSHAHFIASASPKSDFNPSQTPKAGQDFSSDQAPPADHAVGPTRQEKESQSSTEAPGQWQGKLSPTSSHLFKLLLPLPSPASRSASPSDNPDDVSRGKSTAPRQTAFLLHPSQPLSHLSRLIIGSLPPEYRESEITYLSLTGQADDLDSHLRNAEEQDQADTSGRQEGGPYLHERSEEDGRWQEVSWSQSTDLSDFIKQSCLNERFKIVISPTSEAARASLKKERSGIEGGQQGDLVLEVIIPSFASRTHYIRRRLVTLTKELDKMTKQKKTIDYRAHKGAQRLAVAALGGGVAYWVAVIRYTFFTDAGWDLMEPVTWATGFAALLGSAAFLIYHNREVSYSSLLDLSITARQRKLYDEAGLDIERWTEMVAEAKTLRREISRIAADYDIEWRGELENLADAASRTLRSRKETDLNSDTKNGTDHPNSRALDSMAKQGQSSDQQDGESESEAEGDGKIDVDATINEAAELAEQSEEKRSKEQAAQRKGEVLEPSNGKTKTNGKHKSGGDRGSRARQGEEKESESEVRGRARANKIIDG